MARLNVVADYGADPTGILPSGAKVQQAIADASARIGKVLRPCGSGPKVLRPGPIVYIPTGVYNLEQQLELLDGVAVIGDDSLLLDCRSSDAARDSLICLKGGNLLEGIRLDSQSTSSPCILDGRRVDTGRLNRDGSTVYDYPSRSVIRGCKITGPDYPPEAFDLAHADEDPSLRLKPLVWLDGWQNRIEGCVFAGGAIAVLLGAAANACRVTDSWYSLYQHATVKWKRTFVEIQGGEGITVDNNTIENVTHAFRVTPARNDPPEDGFRRVHCTIANNYIENVRASFVKVYEGAKNNDTLVVIRENHMITARGSNLRGIRLVAGSALVSGNWIGTYGGASLKHGVSYGAYAYLLESVENETQAKNVILCDPPKVAMEE